MIKIKSLFKEIVFDETWAKRGERPLLKIAVCTFAILALELALIRWTTTQMRAFAYFNNVVLISAFLGMGVGLALGRRFPGLIHLALPTLALVGVPLAFAESLELVHLKFPDPMESVYSWDSVESSREFSTYVVNMGKFFGIYSLICLLFVLLGGPVGYLFSRTDNVKAYSYDLLGSLLGSVAFTGVTFLNTGPASWLLIGGLPLVFLTKRLLSVASLALVGLLGFYSIQGAWFSPYNRIDLRAMADGVELRVNRDFHQYMLNLSPETVAQSGQRSHLLELRRGYDLAFAIGREKESALIVGGGTGNDVQAALRNGYGRVYSCDIDGMIMDLGKWYHPESPYSDDRVIPVVKDARAFFEQHEGGSFDVVCYGILDSHAMLSSMSSLRLDNFVYTREGIRTAWEHVSERGHLSLSFGAVGSPWLIERLYWTITEATGHQPVCLINGSYAITFIVSKNWDNIDLTFIENLEQIVPRRTAEEVRVSTDDWPFLYLNPDTVPWPYLIMLGIILSWTVLMVPFAYGWKNLRRDFDMITFCMGAAFLLLQTRGVTAMALLLGSTWIVNSAMFISVLLLLWLATLAVEKWKLHNPFPWFVGLFLSLLLLKTFDFTLLHDLPVVYRGLIGGVVNGLPIGFAGVIFPLIFRKSHNSAASLGSNLIGAVLGGCLEYLSMRLGLSNLVLIAMAFYLAAFGFVWRRGDN